MIFQGNLIMFTRLYNCLGILKPTKATIVCAVGVFYSKCRMIFYDTESEIEICFQIKDYTYSCIKDKTVLIF